MITSTSTTTPDHAHFDAYKAPVGFLPGSAPDTHNKKWHKDLVSQKKVIPYQVAGAKKKLKG